MKIWQPTASSIQGLEQTRNLRRSCRMMRRTFPILILFCAIWLCGAWYSCDGESPAEICDNSARLWANKVKACDERSNWAEEVQAFIDSVAFGDCGQVYQIRDPKSLADRCLPWLIDAPCGVIFQRDLLPACRGQFLAEDPNGWMNDVGPDTDF